MTFGSALRAARLAKGTIKSNRIRERSGRLYYGTRITGNLPLMADLAALGVLDKDTVKKLVIAQEAKKAKRDMGYAAKNLLDHAAASGVVFTRAQERVLKRNAKHL